MRHRRSIPGPHRVPEPRWLLRPREEAHAPELYERPLMPYTQALISAVPSPDPDVELRRERNVLQGDIPSPIDPPSGCRFRTRFPQVVTECALTEPVLRQILPSHVAGCHVIEG